MAMKMKARQVAINLPFGIGGVTFVANETEQRAAWALYFELATRVSARALDADNVRLRGALGSLHALFQITRDTLRAAGPEVAHGEESLGPLAIRILNDGLAPYLSRWHHRLAAHEEMQPEGISGFEHERNWPYFQEAVDELALLQDGLAVYIAALGEIAGVGDASN